MPAPRVMIEPGERVWLEMMYWECEFGVMISLFTTIGAGALLSGVNALRAEVVMLVEPAALVVVRIMAGRWVIRDMVVPWALVEVMIAETDVDMGARERLVEVMMLP